MRPRLLARCASGAICCGASVPEQARKLLRPAASGDGALVFQPAVCQLEHGVEYEGSVDILKVNEVDDADECARICLALPDCTHFSWVGEAHHRSDAHDKSEAPCIARGGATASKRSARRHTVIGVCRKQSEQPAEPASADVASEDEHGCTLEQDTDYNDGYFALLKPAESANHCAAACSQIEACTHFSWIGFPSAGDSWYKNCYLKGGAPRNRTAKDGIVGGRCPQAARAPGATLRTLTNKGVSPLSEANTGSVCALEEGIDYSDGYAVVFRGVMTPDVCAEKCVALPGCTHFSWMDPANPKVDDGRSCYVKNGNPQTRRKQKNVTSGVCRQAAEVNVTFTSADEPAADFDCTLETGVDYDDDFVAEVRQVSSASECGGACMLLDGCTHFSWVSNETAGHEWYRNCYLKEGTPTGRHDTDVVISGHCKKPALDQATPRLPESKHATPAKHLVAAGYSDSVLRATATKNEAKQPHQTGQAAPLAPRRSLPRSGSSSAQRHAQEPQDAVAPAISEEVDGLQQHGFGVVLCIASITAMLALLGMAGFGIYQCVAGAGRGGYAPVDAKERQENFLAPSEVELLREAQTCRSSSARWSREVGGMPLEAIPETSAGASR